eukprot:CAMPEP_0183396782 /NCGR_PEP_ID=MMETSP0370-20130417/10193_1 /TAXON_ID=268820 /ORGANISM="Peridinium aciculiferum, Strain PAER-2" /LENGTH=36 /DNA_ID= /DNA_START= /DNA_END= /DNA_ORIENTATION=
MARAMKLSTSFGLLLLSGVQAFRQAEDQGFAFACLA